MSQERIRIRELAGWGFDNYEHRPAVLAQRGCPSAAGVLSQRTSLEQAQVLRATGSPQLTELFDSYAKRPELVLEMTGLSWRMGVVDIRCLLAFQRRLALSSEFVMPSVPAAGDWPALCALSFGLSKRIEYQLTHVAATNTFVLQSSNPDLHVRMTADPAFPISIHAGGTFFEVARYRGRWFLRDGYHRAFALLAAGVFEVPAVIVEAASLDELGANQPWFFPEEVLFSQAPPRVADFLNDDLVLEYERAPFLKTIRIQIDESLTIKPIQGDHA